MTEFNRILKATGVVLRLAWLGACVLTLVAGLTALRHPEDPNNMYGVVIFHSVMRFLTFPLGFLAWYVLYALYWLVRGPFPAVKAPELQLWIFWGALVVVGYLQWFKLVPYLFASWWESRQPAKLKPRCVGSSKASRTERFNATTDAAVSNAHLMSAQRRHST